jgi:hypothetical protein
MSSLEKDVLELESYLKNAELDKRFSVAILSGHFLAADFVDRFLHHQGFNVITLDFEAMDTLENVDIDTFIEDQMALAQEVSVYMPQPVIHWRRFAALQHDNYRHNEKATAWLKEGVEINKKNDNESDITRVFVPIIISGNRDLSMDNRDLLNHRHIISMDNLCDCTHLHQFNTIYSRESKKRIEQLQDYFNNRKSQAELLKPSI